MARRAQIGPTGRRGGDGRPGPAGRGLNPALLVVLISLTFAALVAIDAAARLRQGEGLAA